MASRDERELDMSRGVPGETDVPASEEAFSLEEILAEYGAGREQRLMEAVEQEVLREESPRQAPPDPPRTEQPAPAPERPPAPRTRGERTAPAERGPAAPVRTEPPAPAEPRREEARQEELPRPPRPVTLEDVVGSTVDAVMEETPGASAAAPAGPVLPEEAGGDRAAL